MKLIDLLVKELPKSGGWPSEAVIAIYFSHKKGVTFYDKDGMGIKNGVSFICMDIHGVRREEVTREEFEAAIAKNDGWIEWGGGGCPVPQGTIVDVRYRCGKENHHVKAGIFGDDSGSDPEHHAGHWGGYNSQWDIISYRLHLDINSRANDDRLEQDLNECIGQDVDMPEWNGDGLPPAGCECEVMSVEDVWYHIKVVHSDGVRKMAWYEMNSSYQNIDCTNGADLLNFRPLRTESEKVREVAVEAITKSAGVFAVKSVSEKLYDEIAAGKIPGVKLDK